MSNKLKNLPISCKCITYGRVEYLEESIYSFLHQNYEGERELLIVNDYPLQTLHFDHPQVKIINLKETFSSIGAKENFAVSNCSFDTIAVWDDDDMALSNHLENINKFFPGHDLLHWNRGIFLHSNEIRAIRSVGNSGIVYSKNIWQQIGGHPLENAGYDTTFVKRILSGKGNVCRAMPRDEDVSWIYTWGGGSYHMSGQGKDHSGRENVIKRHSAHVEALRKQGEIPTGDIELKPRWKHDYAEMHQNYLQLTPDQKGINTRNLDGWSIGREILYWMLERIPKGSTILEFGAGKGTIELSKFYDVISIEHNEKWILAPNEADCHHAKLIDGWYDMEVVKEAIKDKDIKLIILDGPPGSGNRSGFLNNILTFNKKASIIIDDTNRPQEAALADKISVAFGRKNFRIKGHEKSFDII